MFPTLKLLKIALKNLFCGSPGNSRKSFVGKHTFSGRLVNDDSHGRSGENFLVEVE